MIDRRIKLRHLRCFLEVARLRSVVGAAESLGVSQPAVSKTLRELEEIVGGSLMDRSRSGVFLTDAGELFHHYASAGLAALQQGLSGVARGRMTQDLLLRIGVLPTVAARLAPAAVHRYSRNPSAATLSLVTGPNRFLLETLRAGDLDLVIGRLAAPEMMRDLSFIHLYSEPVVLVVRPGHPLLAGGHPDLGVLADYPVLIPPPDAVIRRSVEQLLLVHNVTDLPHRIETVSNAFGRAYTRQYDAIWIISHGVVANDLDEGYLVRLPVAIDNVSGPVGLTLRATADPSPPLRLLMQTVTATARELHPA